MNDVRTHGNFEFSEEQNRLIADLAAKMRDVGAFLVVIGGLSILGAVLSALQTAFSAVFALLMIGAFFLLTGVWSRRSGRSFRRVVDTVGRDIEHTMHALGDLDKFYTLNFWLVIAYLMVVFSAFFMVPSLH